MNVDVIVPAANGDYLPVKAEWFKTLIIAHPHFSVGEGAIGFREGVTTVEGDFEAAAVFSDMLGSCYGRYGRDVGLNIVNMVVPQLSLQTPPPPTLPGNVNVIYGSPICIKKPNFTINENSMITVEGRYFAAGDQIVVEETVCPTTFVNSTLLTATVAGLKITGGHKRVIVRRNICDSNVPFTVFFEATLFAPQSLQCRPYDMVSIAGFGFEPSRMMARINGQYATVVCNGANTLTINTFRPTSNPAKLNINRDAEEAIIEVFQESRSIGVILLKFEIFRVVFFGDSVVWGQGLLENQKFSALLGQSTQATNDTRTLVTLDRGAHSGATIMEDPKSKDPSVFEVSPCVFDIDALPPRRGEVPLSPPSIFAQIKAWDTQFQPVKESIKLIVLDGGINDLGVTSIIFPLLDDPIFFDSALVNKTNATCDIALQAVLQQALLTFPNAKIIVTGYYPIITAATDWLLFLEITAPLFGLGLSLVALSHARMTYRCRLFLDTAHTAMRRAIRIVDPTENRIRFVDPDFKSENALWASNSFLWGFPSDPLYDERKLLCSSMGGTFTCPIASLGHPNALGAKAYTKAIREVLEKWK